MTRRDLLQNVAILLGGSIVGGSVFSISGCKSADKPVNALFNESQVAFMNEIADTILPATSSPGAKAANVGNFMSVMVLDCYTERDQKVFLAGLDKIDELSEKQFNASFVNATPAERTTLLTVLDKEQKEYQGKKGKDDPSHYFRMMKELSVLGYFSSKEGATQALRYLPVPGKYDGSFPYKKGDKAWATT
ncbi:MAG: gluconate 2-dehydrogenase subunit 3 family protein [Ferruginibacter sp.]|nr:gluconate 2-dehydrogenase subunit 3 family protein [Ferruginibacter sp.]